VKRAGLVLLFVLGLGAAGGVSAGVVQTSTTTGTTTTTAAVIADGVTIGGVVVGGLTRDEAFATVDDSFAQPLPLVVAGHRLFPTPKRLHVSASVNGAVAQALAAPPGTAIKLRVKLDRAKATAYVVAVAKRFDRKPLDAQLALRNLRPVVSRERAGRSLRRVQSLGRIFAALVANSRSTISLDFKSLQPKLTRSAIGPVVVIRRGSNRLYLYDGMRLRRVFGVATGQSSYPTPLGRWNVVVKWRNPWWYPPHSPWAQGAKPIPPGPGNPLGTRWMGLSASGVGIHGTPDDASIGYSASHGCIRMHISDAEWLFNHVRIGTTVFIVSR
jgi:L,D-transpeptidase catalytic domain/Putative peptidoglycan binding domain